MPRVQIREKSQITLPRQVMRDHGLRVGDEVDVEVRGGSLLLTPTVSLDREILLGRADAAAGRYTEFDSAEEMIEYLHRPIPKAVHRFRKK